MPRPDKKAIEERRDEVMRLKRMGLSSREIRIAIESAHGLFSHVTIAKDVNLRLDAASDTNPKDHGRARALHISRYEALLRAWWPKALGGNVKALNQLLKILRAEERCRGFAKPLRIAVGGDADSEPVQVIQAPAIDLDCLTTEEVFVLRAVRDRLKPHGDDDDTPSVTH